MSRNISELKEELLQKGFVALKRCEIEEDVHNLEHYTLEKTTDPTDPNCTDNTVFSLHSNQAIGILDRHFNHVKIHGLE